MQTLSLQQSVAMIPDGAIVMIGGFMAVGSPERAIDEMVRQRKRDITVIANDTASPGRGIGKLISAKAVRKAVESLPNDNDTFESRESYLHVGFAIKAAIGDTPEAFDLWWSWCARWRGGYCSQ